MLDSRDSEEVYQAIEWAMKWLCGLCELGRLEGGMLGLQVELGVVCKEFSI